MVQDQKVIENSRKRGDGGLAVCCYTHRSGQGPTRTPKEQNTAKPQHPNATRSSPPVNKSFEWLSGSGAVWVYVLKEAPRASVDQARVLIMRGHMLHSTTGDSSRLPHSGVRAKNLDLWDIVSTGQATGGGSQGSNMSPSCHCHHRKPEPPHPRVLGQVCQCHEGLVGRGTPSPQSLRLTGH